MKETTGFRNGDLFCFNCGDSHKLPLPLEAGLAADKMKEFHERHKDCKKTWTEPVAESNSKSESENERWWLSNGEHGISSKTMFNHLTDNGKMRVDWEGTPSDPGDFSRCHKLLEAIPQYREKLHRMKSVSPVWSKLVDNWDRLTEMIKEQYITNKANGMYEFMKELGC